MRKLFTSESVTEGHPDKLCDQISDAVLDAILAEDPMARVACETFATTGMITVMGEITTSTYADIPAIVRKTVMDIGYDAPEKSFNGATCAVTTAIHEQSPDIAMGVNDALETRATGSEADTGAGDQGMMFGFACNETLELMPLPISLAHSLTRRLAAVRREEEDSPLLPDGKSQVTVEYSDDGKPLRIDTVVISSQHRDDVTLDELRPYIIEKVCKAVLPEHLIDGRTRYLINPTGRFVIGGPMGDTGLTGRKIIVDTYGGYSRHGGGAFSGKDPTKVDRSAAYMARYIAKNVVAAGLADKCEVQLAYAIGVAEPVSLLVDAFGSAKVDNDLLSRAVAQVFDARPAAIIDQFQLRRPIYRQLAAYGHMGRTDIDVPWEHTDKCEALRAAVAALK